MSAPSSTAAMASESARDQQILSAKKKLKSYRAKQALMAQKRTSSSSSHSRSGSGVRSTDTAPTTATVAEALSNEIVSQASTSAAPAASASSSHTRTASRGHGRGHSRAGSISITPNALWNQAQAIASSPATTTTSLGRSLSIVAPNAGHARTHSRTHSRNFSRSRPVSISMLGAKKEEPVVVAIEHRAEDGDNFGEKRRSQQFLDSSALFGGAPSSSSLRPASTASAKRLSHVAPVSPGLFDRPASTTAAPSPSARHSRRLSRHARTPSVATKRESMEIMGGLGAGLGLEIVNGTSPMQSMGSSRRRSSRMSNLPSASLLFGSSDPSSVNSSNTNNRMSGQQWDWRKAIADAAEEAEEGAEGRLTALDKLEGRTSAAPRNTTSERPVSMAAAQRASHRLSGHTRTESIQIPNLEEIHQNEINERRASWNTPVLEPPASAPATSASNRRESWGRNLVPPSTSSLLSAGFPSPALNSSSGGRPLSMIECANSPEPEGLGTLMEEEEEDDATSPTRERPSLDMPADGRTSVEVQEIRKQRREVEDDTVKRNRRASLAPKPLKLKSRPPSLYLTPSQKSGLVSSPSMPNFATSPLIADELTPKANMAALPEMEAEEEESRLVGEKEQESSVGMPSRSTTCPDLSTVSAIQKESEEAVAEQAEVKDVMSPAATEVSAAEEEQRQLEELQQQILRAHRNSIIAPSPAPAQSSAESSTTSSFGTPSRQGMRTLRLGSQANLTSIMEAAPTSSNSSGSISGSTTTTSAQRRRSLIMGSLSASSSRDSDFVPFGSSASANTVPTSRAARRSSIIYKPSTATLPESPSTPSAFDPLSSVPLAQFDELKAKAARDEALLESTKKQVEMLERELATETERSAREKAELEAWNADKEEHLFDRAQRAEASASAAEAKMDAIRAELETAKEQLEDLEAEREVLTDDIEGWRSRCQDLEKTLRIEKAKSDEARKLKAAARLRIKQLTDALEQNGIAVPNDDLGVLAALEMPQLDLASVLRSPNLGAASPNLSAITPSGGLSPSLGAEEAPPVITKLLADMRQQIFNLAGSLEHERKQHIQAKEEVARLQQQTSTPIIEGEKTTAVVPEEQSFTSTPDDSISSTFSSNRRSSGVLGKNKRHVFAYDSSMGSFNQSQSSASLSMTTMTDDTAHTDNDSDLSDSFSAKLPSTTSEGELVGLGMGVLGTLDEIEEVSEVSESVEGSNAGTLGASVDKELASPAWIDVEAGVVEVERPSLDISESSFGGNYQDAENAPTTPDLYHSSSTEPSRSNTVAAGSGEHSTSSSSSGESSHAAPSTPPPPASPRPEFLREWSFEWGKTRARKTPSAEHTVEDFFGIFSEDILPPLNTSEEPLDLPPITLNPNGTLNPSARLNKDGKPITASGANMRSASIFGSRRPPVARSAYLRESFDSTAPNAAHSTSMSGMQGVHVGGGGGFGHESQASSASSLAAIGSRALSRMSLQGLTGAFSGLSGYLTRESYSATVGAAKMCNSLDVENGADGSYGGKWTTQHRFEEEDEEEEEAFHVKNAKFDIESAPVSYKRNVGQVSMSSSHNGTAPPVKSQQQQRRYVRKSAVPPPKATPVWLLDFSKLGVGNGPVFNL